MATCHCGHHLVGEEKCTSFEALLRAIDLLTNTRLQPVFQRESEACSFAARLSRSLFSRSSYIHLASENSRPPPLGPGAKNDGCFCILTVIIFSTKRELVCNLAKCELHNQSDAWRVCLPFVFMIV